MKGFLQNYSLKACLVLLAGSIAGAICQILFASLLEDDGIKLISFKYFTFLI